MNSVERLGGGALRLLRRLPASPVLLGALATSAVLPPLDPSSLSCLEGVQRLQQVHHFTGTAPWPRGEAATTACRSGAPAHLARQPQERAAAMLSGVKLVDRAEAERRAKDERRQQKKDKKKQKKVRRLRGPCAGCRRRRRCCRHCRPPMKHSTGTPAACTLAGEAEVQAAQPWRLR